MDYCLEQHFQRKKQLENMIVSGQFDKLDFIEIHGDLDNPIFHGRSTYLLHTDNNFFNRPGYSYMPWISYSTLCTNNKIYLIFCWLISDKHHAKHLKGLLKKCNFKDIIAVLAYACSDGFAVEEDFHKKHSPIIEEIIKSFRVY